MEDVFLMIYDGFMFYRDMEILDIRLHELNDIVDKFVLVECTKTFRGKDKPLYFDQNKYQFTKYLHKIIHVVASEPPEVNMDGRKHERQFCDFSIEWYQRDMIMEGLKGCSSSDVIMISDVDEIPMKEQLSNLYFGSNYFYTCQQRMYYYYLNTFFPGTIWYGTHITTYDRMFHKRPNRFRKRRKRGTPLIGGWHFSHLVGNKPDAIEKLQEKMRISGHYELDTPNRNSTDNLGKCLSELRGYHHYSGCGKTMDIDPLYNLPQYVIDNKNRFEVFLKC